MPSFSHRERVLAAFNHEEADRVPMDLMGNATMILDEAYFRLRDHLGLAPIAPVREGSSANYYDERILERFDVDFRRLFLKPDEGYNRLAENPDGSFADLWSTTYRNDGIYVTAVSHPLAAAESPAEVEAFPWPVAEKMFDATGLRERARELYFGTDYALVARNPFVGGFIDRACQLLGTENFCMSLLLRPRVVETVLDRILEIYSRVYSLFLQEVGEYVQMVETADDIGTQSSLLISPDHYRQFVKPLERRLYGLIREKTPGAAVFRHTDGAIAPLIPDLIEVGVDVLNPVQTSAQGMDGDALKRAFGSRLTFHGGIETLTGPGEDIEEEVKSKLRMFKGQGGYVFASCNHIIDTPPELIVHLFDCALRHGAY